jgi:hypothetical protein
MTESLWDSPIWWQQKIRLSKNRIEDEDDGADGQRANVGNGFVEARR